MSSALLISPNMLFYFSHECPLSISYYKGNYFSSDLGTLKTHLVNSFKLTEHQRKRLERKQVALIYCFGFQLVSALHITPNQWVSQRKVDEGRSVSEEWERLITSLRITSPKMKDKLMNWVDGWFDSLNCSIDEARLFSLLKVAHKRIII